MERHGFEELKRVRILYMYVISKVITIIIVIIKPATAKIAISTITIIIVIINNITVIDL